MIDVDVQSLTREELVWAIRKLQERRNLRRALAKAAATTRRMKPRRTRVRHVR